MGARALGSGPGERLRWGQGTAGFGGAGVDPMVEIRGSRPGSASWALCDRGKATALSVSSCVQRR